MNDLHIEYFLAAAKHLSITKGAQEKFVTQPAVSRHIAALEDELGVRLFNRENKGLSLTRAGQIFKDYFEMHNKNLESLTKMIKGNEDQQKEYLRIGCGSNWDLSEFLPDILEKMRIQYPNIEMRLENYGFEHLVNALNQDDIDVAMGISHNMFDLATIERYELTKIPRVLLYSKNNPVVCKVNNPVPADFSEQKFLISVNDNNVIGLVNSYCKPYGFTPKIEIMKNNETVFANISNGFGVTIVDGWTMWNHHKNFHYIHLNSKHHISVAWKKDLENEMVLTFVEKLRRKVT